MVIALVLAGALTGCGPDDTGLQRDTAHQFQEHVLGVSKAAAANDHAAALTGLDALEAEVASAADSGHISEDRRRRIMTNAAAVRADLTTVINAAAEAAKAAEEASAAEEAAAAEEASAAEEAAAAEAAKAQADAEAAAKAAQENTAPVNLAPAPAPAPDHGKGNAGKGKNRKD
jgi:hypothetical protein